MRNQNPLHHDSAIRRAFSRFLHRQREAHLNFANNILFSVARCFTRKEITNFHNRQFYAEEHSHVINVKYFHNEFSIYVWTGKIFIILFVLLNVL